MARDPVCGRGHRHAAPLRRLAIDGTNSRSVRNAEVRLASMSALHAVQVELTDRDRIALAARADSVRAAGDDRRLALARSE